MKILSLYIGLILLLVLVAGNARAQLHTTDNFFGGRSIIL